jgi:hypothetical protein
MGHLFHKVLLICDQSGLIGKEHFDIDGCKLPTNASKQWSGTHKELRNKSDKLKEAAKNIIDKYSSNDSDKGSAKSSYNIRLLIINLPK